MADRQLPRSGSATANRRAITGLLASRGADQPGRPRPRHRSVPHHGLQPGRRADRQPVRSSRPPTAAARTRAAVAGRRMLVALATPHGRRRRGRHRPPATCGSRSPTAPATVLAEETALVDVDEDGADALDRAAGMVRTALRRRRARDRTTCTRVGMCVPAPARPALRPGPRRASSRAGATSPPPTSCTGASACRSSPTTTPTSARSPSSTTASARGRRRRRLRQGRQRARRRDRARRAPAPRHRRHRGRDRPRAGRRGRPGLPLRQPRLPRDRWSRRPGCWRCCSRRTTRS